MRSAGSSFVADRMKRAAVLALAGALAAGLGPAAPAWAQGPGDEPGEVPIGTFTIGNPQSGFSITEPPAGVPEPRRDGADEGSGWFFQRWEQAPDPDTAESLYEEAMQALQAGHTEEAQRLFERIIATAPRSARVGEARQHLGRLYSRVETGATAMAAPARAMSPPGIIAPLAASVLARARVSTALDGQFLSDAGDRVFFSVGSAVLGTRARGVVAAQARFLKQNPGLSAAVEGHADDGGLSDGDVRALSEQRAAVVRERLIAEGIDADRLVAYGRGGAQKVSDCPQPECAAQNRRAVTILLSGKVAGTPARRRAEPQGLVAPMP